MEVEGIVVSPKRDCEPADVMVEDEEEGQIMDDDDDVESESEKNEEAVVPVQEEKENGACAKNWTPGDEEGEIIDDDDEPMEGPSMGSSTDETSQHFTRKRRYSEDGDKSNSASPAPEDRRTAYERFKNLSFSKKNPFADGGAREVRDYRNARYRNEREGAGRYRRDERDDENRRRDRRFDRDRNDRRDVDDNFRRNNGSGKDGPERDQRRGYNSVNSDGYPAPSQPNIGFGMLPNSLWERIDMFVHSQENQLSNLTDENICDKLVELLELRQEQTRFIKRREKQLEDLHNSIENEHEEIEKLKQDLPPEFFTNQNGGGDSHFDNLSNAPHDGGYGVRTYPPPMDVPLPTGQYTSMPPNMPPNLNGIRGFQPNVPPPNLPPLHVMPPTVFTNPPPTFDVARPPPPLPADLGCMPIPHHLLPHSMKNPTSSAGPSIPLVPDFSVPPPGFPPVAIRANSPGMNQDRFQSAPVYGNDRFARNNEPYNRDRFVGDRLPAPAPTPLRNVVPGMHNPNNQPLSSSWSQPASNDNDSSNRSSREAASASPTLINSVEANFMIEENHEPVSGPGSPNSGMSAVSDDCFNGPSSQADQEQSAQPDETYDVVSDDEDGSHMI